ncbi:MAG: hypothetical protein ACR2K2_12420 [Mycobacteriales bacterium]
MRFFKRRHGTEADTHVGTEIRLQRVAERDLLTFGWLHHLFFASEASALRVSLDSVVGRADVGAARDVCEVLTPTPPAPAPAGGPPSDPEHA